jgi:hypothetical protein
MAQVYHDWGFLEIVPERTRFVKALTGLHDATGDC